MGRWRQLVLNAKKQTDYTVTNYPNTTQVGKVCLSREGCQGEEGKVLMYLATVADYLFALLVGKKKEKEKERDQRFP